MISICYPFEDYGPDDHFEYSLPPITKKIIENGERVDTIESDLLKKYLLENNNLFYETFEGKRIFDEKEDLDQFLSKIHRIGYVKRSKRYKKSRHEYILRREYLNALSESVPNFNKMIGYFTYPQIKLASLKEKEIIISPSTSNEGEIEEEEIFNSEILLGDVEPLRDVEISMKDVEPLGNVETPHSSNRVLSETPPLLNAENFSLQVQPGTYHYIVSEEIKGETYRDFNYKYKVESYQRQAWCQQLYYALKIAKNLCGFNHNDIHPANIMLYPTKRKYIPYILPEGIKKIPTFGYIAVLIDYEDASFTHCGEILSPIIWETELNQFDLIGRSTLELNHYNDYLKLVAAFRNDEKEEIWYDFGVYFFDKIPFDFNFLIENLTENEIKKIDFFNDRKTIIKIFDYLSMKLVVLSREQEIVKEEILPSNLYIDKSNSLNGERVLHLRRKFLASVYYQIIYWGNYCFLPKSAYTGIREEDFIRDICNIFSVENILNDW